MPGIDSGNLDREPTPDEDQAVLDRHVAQLREHFDAVQIVAVKHINDSEGTISYSNGAGNWYARTGLMREWLLKIDERERESIRRQAREGDDD